MLPNTPPTKSKWGVSALLQQAVSGVESRLDVLLANEDDLPPKKIPTKASSSEERGQNAASAPKSAVECMIPPSIPPNPHG
jgi:TATA element modulatory factor